MFLSCKTAEAIPMVVMEGVGGEECLLNNKLEGESRNYVELLTSNGNGLIIHWNHFSWKYQAAQGLKGSSQRPDPERNLGLSSRKD